MISRPFGERFFLMILFIQLQWKIPAKILTQPQQTGKNSFSKRRAKSFRSRGRAEARLTLP